MGVERVAPADVRPVAAALGPPPVRAAEVGPLRAGRALGAVLLLRAAVPALADGRVGGVLGRRHRQRVGPDVRDVVRALGHLDLVLDEDLVRALVLVLEPPPRRRLAEDDRDVVEGRDALTGARGPRAGPGLVEDAAVVGVRGAHEARVELDVAELEVAAAGRARLARRGAAPGGVAAVARLVLARGVALEALARDREFGRPAPRAVARVAGVAVVDAERALGDAARVGGEPA